MRDINQLHPELRQIIPLFLKECESKGYKVKIGECLRTVKEQDILYAQGRTTPGIIVTKAKGVSYSSLHQWGVAFDFYLDMDIDNDGKTSDDAFNDSKGTFKKVGQIGKSLGLFWGGDFKSIYDGPHFQIQKFSPDGTANYLKSYFETPDDFFNTWMIKPTKQVSNITASKEEIKWLQHTANMFALEHGITLTFIDGLWGKDTARLIRAIRGLKRWEVTKGYTATVNLIKALDK